MPYITEYSVLHPKEYRQLGYKRRYKAEVPHWDDSMVLLTQQLKERVRPPVDVLDFGCGRGNFVIDELGNLFNKKVGYDVSPEAVVGNKSVDTIVFGDENRFSFAKETFDLVVSLWVFEHVQNPASIFAEVFRILRPGGFFAFVTPNKRSLLIQLRRLISKNIANVLLDLFYGRKDDDIFDVRYRANSVKEITQLAKEAGFTIEHLKENEDPSYTSFGTISYLLSKWASSLPLSASKPHLVVILRKPA